MSAPDDIKKVLIVDDDPSILLSLEFLMAKQGYRVFIARNGTEALEIIQAQAPHVIVLDVMMPDMDGYDVCQFVRKRKEWNYIRIMFLSAKGKQEDLDRGLRLGANRYLTKPFSTRQLMREVQELLEEISAA